MKRQKILPKPPPELMSMCPWKQKEESAAGSKFYLHHHTTNTQKIKDFLQYFRK